MATDIVYIARHLLGLVPVPESFRAQPDTIPPDAEMANRIDLLGMLLDVDVNETVQMATDIIYIARDLLDLPPVPVSFRVLDPAIPPDEEIEARIQALLAS